MPTGPTFTPFSESPETVKLDAAVIGATGLDKWAAQFALGTAGYRDLLDPENLFNTDVPFNGLSVAMMCEARAQLATETGLKSLHVGGEVRPHTQELIDLAARIYAAHGIRVHLRPDGVRTTPIWLSSFGVFYEELDGGENFTASHSQSYKGGWKPMTAAGGQLLEMAGQVSRRVRELVEKAKTEGLEIRLAGCRDELIVRDFDPTKAYTEVLKSIIPGALLEEVRGAEGFRAGICTEGGSMAPTAREIFGDLGIDVGPDATVFFTHEAERSDYHGIGIVDGVNHGVDPGKWQVYKNVGAQQLLRDGACDVFFIWDPDGDRFNMVTAGPATMKSAFDDAGLETEDLDDDRCLVFFKPNQIYFMLTALKLDALDTAGELEDYDWIVATTYPTSMSIGEVATTFNARTGGSLSTFRVPVGFKHFASLVSDLEGQIADGTAETRATDVTGKTTVFGPRPRLLMMAEESGGAAMGPAEPVFSRHGNRTSLAPKEKDAMQIGVLALCLAARLHRQEKSFGEFYLDLLERFDTRYRFYERLDFTLFDEALKGDEREAAKARGNARKDVTVDFFASLVGTAPEVAAAALIVRMPKGATLPPIREIFHAGDGTVIEFEDQWFELRASGTDAVLRYYMEGREKDQVQELNRSLARLRIRIPETDQ